MSWLTLELKKDIKDVFEPKYGRGLSDSEIVDIASNLVSYMENCSKFIWRLKNEQLRIQN